MDKVVLPFPKDRLRGKWFDPGHKEHQAKMELRTFVWCLLMYTKRGDWVLDPMSGAGTIHLSNYFGRNSYAVEIAEKFVTFQNKNIPYMKKSIPEDNKFYDAFSDSYDLLDNESPERYEGAGILQGESFIYHADSQRAQLPPDFMDACVFSPPYGDLWAFNAKARDTKIMQEKNLVVGYDENPDNVGNMKSYALYRLAMGNIYRNCFSTLKPGAILVSIVKDFMKGGKRVYCSQDNLMLMVKAGFHVEAWHYREVPKATSPFQAKAKRERIAKGKHSTEFEIGYEDILVVKKPGG